MANQTTIINSFGKLTGWNNLTVNLLGRDLEGISELKYDDEVEMKNATGAGMYPIGTEMGNYQAKCEMTLLKEEVDGLQNSIGSGRRIQEIDPFDIICEYEKADGSIQKDIIHNVQFKNRGNETKNGEGKIEVKMNLLCSHITWNAL